MTLAKILKTHQNAKSHQYLHRIVLRTRVRALASPVAALRRGSLQLAWGGGTTGARGLRLAQCGDRGIIRVRLAGTVALGALPALLDALAQPVRLLLCCFRYAVAWRVARPFFYLAPATAFGVR